MNSPQDTLPNDLPRGDDLLAYLDGELDPESRRRIEDQLSTSGELRQRLKEHQQAWDLLDDLPRATVDDSFARTTVEMVAIRAGDYVSKTEQAKRWRQGIVRLMGAFAIVIACIAGYFLTARRLAEPNDRLVEDLPILEHLDAYRNAGTIEFLRQLDQQELFQEEMNDAM